MKNTFPREERLSGRSLITSLFKGGQTFHVTPFRITWMVVTEQPVPIRVLMSVPKHYIRKAVMRNLVRRRMKEAYRLTRQPLMVTLRDNECRIMVCITYTSREILPYDLIREKIILILHRLSKENEKVTG
jgi:ribonuclease P protein component